MVAAVENHPLQLLWFSLLTYNLNILSPLFREIISRLFFPSFEVSLCLTGSKLSFDALFFGSGRLRESYDRFIFLGMLGSLQLTHSFVNAVLQRRSKEFGICCYCRSAKISYTYCVLWFTPSLFHMGSIVAKHRALHFPSLEYELDYIFKTVRSADLSKLCSF